MRRISNILDRPEIARLNEPGNQLIQVERFLPGREFALEGLVTNGKLHTLAIFDKPDPLDGPYFEETTYLTPSHETREVQSELRHAAQKAIDALGLTHGPVHAEMRLTNSGVFVLEVAARPIGGLVFQGAAVCERADSRGNHFATFARTAGRVAVGITAGRSNDDPHSQVRHLWGGFGREIGPPGSWHSGYPDHGETRTAAGNAS